MGGRSSEFDAVLTLTVMFETPEILALASFSF